MAETKRGYGRVELAPGLITSSDKWSGQSSAMTLFTNDPTCQMRKPPGQLLIDSWKRSVTKTGSLKPIYMFKYSL